jgi:hypothetical protein
MHTAGIYLIAPAFILWRLVYEISMQAVTFFYFCRDLLFYAA